MANLDAFTIDRDAVRGGEWITVGTGDNTFEIKTRGFTPTYRDGLSKLRRNAAREMNNRMFVPGEALYTADTLPPTVDDQCQGQALADYCVLDIRGLTNGGQPVTVDAFKALLREPEGRQGLLILAIGAANRVGMARQAEREVAEGNSSPGSDTP